MVTEQRNDITEEEVWKIADSCYAKKVWPTQEKVRELLGNRGSFTTIQKYLDSWRQTEYPLPDKFDALFRLYAEIRKEACRDLDETRASLEENYRKQIEEAVIRVNDAEQEKASALKVLEDLRQELAKLSNIKIELENKLVQEEKGRSIAEEANRLLKQQLQEVKINHQQQIDQLANQREQSRQQLENQHIKNQQEYEARIDKLENQLGENNKHYFKEIEDLKANNEGLRLKLEVANKENAITVTNLEAYKSKCSDAEIKLSKLELTNLKGIQKLQALEKEFAANRAENTHLLGQITECKQQIKEQQKSLLEANIYIGKLEEMNSRINIEHHKAIV
jgi:chromosome segregation ATPase